MTRAWTTNHPPPPDPGVGGLKPCRGLAEKGREQLAQAGPGRFLPTGSLWLTQQPRNRFPFLPFSVPTCPERWAEWSPATLSSRHYGRQGFSLEIQGLSWLLTLLPHPTAVLGSHLHAAPLPLCPGQAPASPGHLMDLLGPWARSPRSSRHPPAVSVAVVKGHADAAPSPSRVPGALGIRSMLSLDVQGLHSSALASPQHLVPQEHLLSRLRPLTEPSYRLESHR